MVDFDFSEINKLAADIGAAGVEVIPFVRKALDVGARNVKDEWQSDAKGRNNHGSSRRYPYSIDYDLKLDTDGSMGAEIGPNMGKKGGRHGFLEDANGGVRSAPQHSGRKAAKQAEADFIKGIEKAGEDALNA